LGSFNPIYKEFFKPPYPARTTIFGCLGDLLKFEVEAIVYMGNRKKFRIALLGIYHESNTFIAAPTTIQDFKNGHWLKGESIRKEYENAAHEIGGMLEVLDAHDVEVIPVMFAEATPGGIVSAEAYSILLEEMMQGLSDCMPVDACLVIPHGAGVAEGHPDMDGHFLSTIRNKVGNDIPVIGTLDPHANVSQVMAKATDALIAYKTNPHIDQREAGKIAASLLIKTLNKEVRPVQHLIQTPVIISIEQQNTSVSPCRDLYGLAAEISKHTNVLSVSVVLGFPYADVNEMGSSFILVCDGDSCKYSTYGKQLEEYIIRHKKDFVGEKKDIKSQLPLIKNFKMPVLLLDMGDNVGGGSPGNSTFLLNALEDYGSYKSFFCIFDPAAVKKACSHKDNEEFDLAFGNNNSVSGSEGYSGLVTLIRTADGKFSENSARHGGQVNFNMGKIAIVLTRNKSVVMLTSLRVPPFSLNQLTSFGIDPAEFDVLVAKGVNAPVAAYADVCPTMIQIDTPGVTQADITLFPYKNRRKPLFPFEK
jgi:microcystin degradation protein MlrC